MGSGSLTLMEQTTKIHKTLRFPLVLCDECGQVFDLSDDNDADEWYYGHDCEG